MSVQEDVSRKDALWKREPVKGGSNFRGWNVQDAFGGSARRQSTVSDPQEPSESSQPSSSFLPVLL